jgi:hypothetical protein
MWISGMAVDGSRDLASLTMPSVEASRRYQPITAILYMSKMATAVTALQTDSV